MGSLRLLRARALTTLIAAVALIAGLAACGEEEEPTTTAADETVTDATDPPTEETVPDEPPGEEAEQAGGNEETEAGLPVPEEAVEDTVNDALASGDPQLACEESVTDAYVSEAYGSAQGCRSAQGGGAVAEQVTLVELELDDSRASAVVRFDGGTYDGEEGDVEFVLEDDAWKLDSLQVDVPPGP
jgi:hypothetical protein